MPQYDAVDQWDTQGGAIDTRSADRDQNRYGSSQVALESGEIAQRKSAVTSMMDAGVTRDEEGIDRVPDPPDSLKPVRAAARKLASPPSQPVLTPSPLSLPCRSTSKPSRRWRAARGSTWSS